MKGEQLREQFRVDYVRLASTSDSVMAFRLQTLSQMYAYNILIFGKKQHWLVTETIGEKRIVSGALVVCCFPHLPYNRIHQIQKSTVVATSRIVVTVH